VPHIIAVGGHAHASMMTHTARICGTDAAYRSFVAKETSELPAPPYPVSDIRPVASAEKVPAGKKAA